MATATANQQTVSFSARELGLLHSPPGESARETQQKYIEGKLGFKIKIIGRQYQLLTQEIIIHYQKA